MLNENDLIKKKVDSDWSYEYHKPILKIPKDLLN